MKQKTDQNHVNLSRYMISSLVVVAVLVAVFGVMFAKHSSTADAVASNNKSKAATVTSNFSFTGADGWVQGPSNQTSMALFHGSSISQPASDGCFVSAEYKAGTIDIAAELQKNQAALASTGYTIASTDTKSLTLHTNTGSQQYQLHQFSNGASSSDAHPIMGGQELGYLQLSGGYIKLIGYCNTSEQLAATIPALQAFTFSGVK